MSSLILRTLFSGKELAREINRTPEYVSQRICGHKTWSDGDLYLINKAVEAKKKLLEEESA
jgi:hypothetical protein